MAGYAYHYYRTAYLPREEISKTLRSYTLQASMDGSPLTATLPEVLLRYDPDAQQYTQPVSGGATDIGSATSTGEAPLDVEIIDRRAKGRYLVAYREGAARLELEVDTIGKTVEPANDEAKRYFTFRDCSFDRHQSRPGLFPFLQGLAP